MLAFFHGAALCHAAGFPIKLYVEAIASHTPAQKIRFGEMIVKRSYNVSDATIEVDAAAYEHVTKLSQEFGIDAAFPKTVAGYMDRAIAEGRGQQALAAVFELMIDQAP
jgi:hypothetical protein